MWRLFIQAWCVAWFPRSAAIASRDATAWARFKAGESVAGLSGCLKQTTAAEWRSSHGDRKESQRARFTMAGALPAVPIALPMKKRLARALRFTADKPTCRAHPSSTLELLKKLRLVNELDLMHLNGERHYYEIRAGADHIHLACFRCGKIEEFESPLFELLKQEIGQERGFAIHVVRMEAGGHCRQCAAQHAAERQG